MKKKGIVTGILFAVMLAFIFQSQIGGFFADLREKAYTAANGSEENIAETSALPDYDESEENNDSNDKEKNGDAPPVPEKSEAASADITYKEVSLYFVDSENDELSAETRSVINQTGLAKTTMEELLTGPSSEKMISYIPEGTSVQSINIEENGLCTVDLSKEIQNTSLTSSEEKNVIESIVNTLSQFDSVNAVQIRVDGNVVESLAGHWDISKPLSAE